MRTILIAAFALSLACLAIGKPAPKNKPAEKPNAIPTLPVNTNWGTLTQAGREFRITGNANWEAVGHIRADGRIFVLWTLLANQSPCPGVYDFVDGELRGLWGFAADIQLNGDGTIEGNVRSDRTYEVPLPKEDVPPGF